MRARKGLALCVRGSNYGEAGSRRPGLRLRQRQSFFRASGFHSNSPLAHETQANELLINYDRAGIRPSTLIMLFQYARRLLKDSKKQNKM